MTVQMCGILAFATQEQTTKCSTYSEMNEFSTSFVLISINDILAVFCLVFIYCFILSILMNSYISSFIIMKVRSITIRVRFKIQISCFSFDEKICFNLTKKYI